MRECIATFDVATRIGGPSKIFSHLDRFQEETLKVFLISLASKVHTVLELQSI